MSNFLDKNGLSYFWNKIKDLCFRDRFDLSDYQTNIIKTSGKVTSITYTSDDSTATTVFDCNDNIKTVTTTVIPNSGTWKYVKIVTITKNWNTSLVSQVINKINK